MATQGTTQDFMELLKCMREAGEPFAPPGKLLFIYDPPGIHQKAIGMFVDDHTYTGGGIDAPFS